MTKVIIRSFSKVIIRSKLYSTFLEGIGLFNFSQGHDTI